MNSLQGSVVRVAEESHSRRDVYDDLALGRVFFRRVLCTSVEEVVAHRIDGAEKKGSLLFVCLLGAADFCSAEGLGL